MKKNYMLHFLVLGYCCLCSVKIDAQINTFKNNGIFKVYSNTVLSSHSDFINTDKAKFSNDGIAYYFGDFVNNGIYDYTKNKKSGKVYFVSEKSSDKKIIGDNLITLNNVVFDNKALQMHFDLQANIDIWGIADFTSGIVKVDSTLNDKTKLSKGMVSFMQNAEHKNVSNNSFVDGQVEKIGSEEFNFPIGNKQYYRPALISAPKGVKDIISSKYIYKDKTFFNSRVSTSKAIEFLNTNEYWLLEKSIQNTSDIILTLTWDENTTPVELLSNPEKRLHIVYWDPISLSWIDQGGIVDIENKTISTPASLNKYGYFTLAAFQETSSSDEITIFNLVTANADGKNDYFIIENINKFPKNTLQVFSRWGVKVYQTSNYDSQENVFSGYANVGSNKNNKLPSGTYYYLLTYEKQNSKTSTTIKKTGYLHLETN